MTLPAMLLELAMPLARTSAVPFMCIAAISIFCPASGLLATMALMAVSRVETWPLQVGGDGALRELGGAGDEDAELGDVAGQVLLGGRDLGVVLGGDAEGVVDEVADVGAPQLQELRLRRRPVHAADRLAEPLSVQVKRGERRLGLRR